MNKLSIKNKLTKVLENSLEELNIKFNSDIEIIIKRSSSEQNGDYFTDIALFLSEKMKLPCIVIANKIAEKVKNTNFIDKITVSSQGFINFYLKKEFILSYINKIINEKGNYGKNNNGKGKKINIQFLSANPFEILNINHGMELTYGDNLARILIFNGFDVTKEYYINDVGDQIKKLGISIKEKYKEICNINYCTPEDSYFGKEIIKIANEIYTEYGDNKIGNEIYFFQEKGIDIFLKNLKKELDYYRVNFNTFTSEKSLYDQCLVEDIINKLRESGNCYIKDDALWLKTTDPSDRQDSILIKSDGDYTYLISNIAYHINKINRGYNKIVDVLVANHDENINQLKSALTILDQDEDILDIKILPILTLKTSKTNEEIITLRDLVNEIGVNEMRYFFSLHPLDNKIDFNIDQALKKSNENPIYYIEKINAKISAILRNYRKIAILQEKYLDLTLNNDNAYIILKKLMDFEDIVIDAAKKEAPNLIAKYVYELADLFHSFYLNEKFITDSEEKIVEKINLLIAIQIVIENSLDLLGIIPREEL